MKKGLLFFSIVFCIGSSALSTLVSGQSTSINTYPEIRHSHFLATTHAINRLEDGQKSSINFIHQRYLNLLNDIYLVDFSAFLRVKKYHQLGVLAYSLKEGPYINKTSAGLQYAYHLKLYREGILSAGAVIGLNSLQYQGSLSGVNGQSTVPDDIGYRHPRYFLYYAYKQLVASSLRPFNTSIKQRKYQEIRVGYKLPLNHKLELQIQGHSMLYEDLHNSYGGSLSIKGYSIFNVGIGTYNLNTTIWQLSILMPEVNDWSVSLTGSYRNLLGASQNNLYYNSWEIGLCAAKKEKAVVYEAEE